LSYYGEYNLGVKSLLLSEEFKREESGTWARNKEGTLVACFEVSGKGKMTFDYGYNYYLYKDHELQDMLKELYDNGQNCATTRKLCNIVSRTLFEQAKEEARIPVPDEIVFVA